MGADEALSTAVLEWGTKEAPDSPPVIARAAEVPVGHFRAGANVAEACDEARNLVRKSGTAPSWQTDGAVTDWEIAP